MTVLIVEDHLPSQYLLYQQITYLGHIALTANNGLEGLAMWREEDVEVIITDCNMPEMNGHEMTVAIRKMEKAHGTRPILIIGLTADAQREELERCIASGMNHALVKPLNLERLNKLIPPYQGDDQEEEQQLVTKDGVHARIAAAVVESNTSESRLIREAMAAADHGDIKRIAHKLKGTAYLLNNKRLLELCVEIEELSAKTSLGDQDYSVVLQLLDELERINRQLDAGRTQTHGVE